MPSSVPASTGTRDVAYDHNSRVVAVTGAATGIGRATAVAFVEAGATVFLLDIDEQAGRAAAAADVGQFVHCDVTSSDAVDRAFAGIAAEHGRLDVLVNNAGGFWQQRTTEDLPLDEWHRVIDLNLNAVFLTSRRAVGLLRASAAGRIVNVGSLSGQVASFRTSPAYAAAKAGVPRTDEGHGHRTGPRRHHGQCDRPVGGADRRIRRVRDQQERDATARSIPLGRYQDASEVASWILFLASKDAGFITGQTISVNGGRHMAQ